MYIVTAGTPHTQPESAFYLFRWPSAPQTINVDNNYLLHSTELSPPGLINS
ncbi:hypothetical protein PtA15_1A288 [Puccinia triticina]|uniref:Uncharacterized protein n=1 Tax=Puccinia triticina TaxID=208348 RepID=A0ABY7C721_9BASI|nr:uncharacterized protein PtA15_1A288 [Puccinia triticina]WAQ80950.1 hypothetical protein PtA15_1A288 [Puccinia triticina]